MVHAKDATKMAERQLVVRSRSLRLLHERVGLRFSGIVLAAWREVVRSVRLASVRSG